MKGFSWIWYKLCDDKKPEESETVERARRKLAVLENSPYATPKMLKIARQEYRKMLKALGRMTR